MHPITINSIITILGKECGCHNCGTKHHDDPVETMVLQVVHRDDGYWYNTSCSNKFVHQDSVLSVH